MKIPPNRLSTSIHFSDDDEQRMRGTELGSERHELLAGSSGRGEQTGPRPFLLLLLDSPPLEGRRRRRWPKQLTDWIRGRRLSLAGADERQPARTVINLALLATDGILFIDSIDSSRDGPTDGRRECKYFPSHTQISGSTNEMASRLANLRRQDPCLRPINIQCPAAAAARSCGSSFKLARSVCSPLLNSELASRPSSRRLSRSRGRA